MLDCLELDKVCLIGETVEGLSSMRFATAHQAQLRLLTACTLSVTFDSRRTENAELINRARILACVAEMIISWLGPAIVEPIYIRWHADEIVATTPHMVSGFQRDTRQLSAALA